ncbi:MAG: sulfatase-like hydrolase/transferase [Verrucomicrobia bacterium]|nr:sulfatase-like hydrolase/transferase [Verrucomicrobiota bacterium]
MAASSSASSIPIAIARGAIAGDGSALRPAGGVAGTAASTRSLVGFAGPTRGGFTVAADPPPGPPPGAVGIDFHHSEIGRLAGSDVAGAIPMSGWQNVDVGGFGNFTAPGFPDTPLAFADGTPAAGTLVITLGSGYNGTTPAGSSTPDCVLMSEYVSWDPVDGIGPEDTGAIGVTGLGPTFTTNGYDVLVYCDADTTGRTFTLRLGAQTAVARDDGTFDGHYVRADAGNAANYARFRGLTTSGFALEMNSDTGRAAVNALQIIPTASLPLELEVSRFEAAPGRIQPGGAATLSWETRGPARLAIAPDVGDVTVLTTNGGGRIAVSPAQTTTYTLTLSHARTNLSATATTRVVVGPPVPNILLFLVDDMGWQDTSEPFHYDAAGQPAVSALNRRYRTPNMQRLAAHALKFTAAYAAPVCTPTRVSLMTGKNPARHRVTNWTSPTGGETDSTKLTSLRAPSGWRRTGIGATETQTLPRLLGQAGYRALHAGKAHFGSIGAYGQYPQNLGFDVNIAGNQIGHPASYYGTNNFGTGSNHVPGLWPYHGSNIFLTEALTLEMNSEIRHAVADGTPFFAYMAHYAVHTPWQIDPRFVANYPGLTGSALAFATLIEGMDKSLGDILGQLDALGAAENTLVVFLTDNGGDFANAPLRNKKGTLYEGGVRVPLLIGWGRTNSANAFQTALPIPAGTRVRDSVAAWDLCPTLLGVAGVRAPEGVDGVDLGGYLRGAPTFHRPQQFAIHFPHNRSNGAATQKPASLWRDGDWKLIYDYESGATQLYHLAGDLSETNDLAAAHPARVLAMTRALARELVRLDALWPERLADGSPVPPLMPNLPGVDTDGDGLSDLTEDPNRNGLRDAVETDPDLADTDGDGTPDGAEVRAGTNPLDPASNFVAFLTVTNGEPRQISWPGRTGATYRAEQSETLQPGSWALVREHIPGEDGTMQLDLSSVPPAPVRFFRVMLE